MPEAEEKKSPGRQPGTLIAGTLAWQISRLDVGRNLLLADEVAKLKQSIERGIELVHKTMPKHRYEVVSCLGVPPDGGTFKLWKVARVK